MFQPCEFPRHIDYLLRRQIRPFLEYLQQDELNGFQVKECTSGVPTLTMQ